jgi:hypothetical protein
VPSSGRNADDAAIALPPRGEIRGALLPTPTLRGEFRAEVRSSAREREGGGRERRGADGTGSRRFIGEARPLDSPEEEGV